MIFCLLSKILKISEKLQLMLWLDQKYVHIRPAIVGSYNNRDKVSHFSPALNK